MRTLILATALLLSLFWIAQAYAMHCYILPNGTQICCTTIGSITTCH